MNWEAAGAIAEIIGVAAVVVSLVYVGFQVKQNTLQLKNDNLRETVRGTLDTNWYFHRDPRAFDVFRRGVHAFESLAPGDKALFHSIVVDLAFYFEIVRNMHLAGLIDASAYQTNRRFLLAVLVTPGGREWLEFADATEPMPRAALDHLKEELESRGPDLRPITELQPWFAEAGGR